ncbi:hypothetical protein TPDSL_09860 [Terrisporobacter petrolearius]|uniref:glycosyltransferase n=1 Tax=Terrisporobacter petrolearius TaxID=1460447 RepID=UPI0033665DBA
MKDILISSFDLEIGGVERSLISMLDKFDYKNYNVDLMLYSHTGEFMQFLSNNKYNLLPESKYYKTYRMPISEIFRNKQFKIGMKRLKARMKSKGNGIAQMQYIWKYTLPYMPKLNKKYDVAISYLWPHYFVSEKVDADTKIAWIHTDYSKIETNIDMDLEMWNKFDYIVAVSKECKNAFLLKYPSLDKKMIVIENITSPEFIKKQSLEKEHDFKKEEGIFKLLSVGRFSEAKGFDNAIKALRIIHDRGYTNVKWYIVGYGGDEALLEHLIKENNLEGKFILLGKRTNPYSYINQCDLYVQPSRYEGKAVTVTEAQILGKAVMITNYVTANSQVINGYDGYITDLSIEGIADGVEKLYKDSKLRGILEKNCTKTDYENKIELKKLYELLKK